MPSPRDHVRERTLLGLFLVIFFIASVALTAHAISTGYLHPAPPPTVREILAGRVANPTTKLKAVPWVLGIGQGVAWWAFFHRRHRLAMTIGIVGLGMASSLLT